MTIQNEDQLEHLKKAGKIVSRVLRSISREISPGVTTAELDKIGERELDFYGAFSAPKLVYDFPGATCISVNNEAAHGVPGNRALVEGDVVNIDVSCSYKGFFADTGGSFLVGKGSDKARRLLSTTKKALWRGLSVARAGRPLNAIGNVIERTVKKDGFSIIENLSGHGVGANIHEPPQVLNFYDEREKEVLHPGLVLAIEPIVSTGPSWVKEQADGWTVSVPEGHLCAQFEHSVVITKGRPIILTA